ncbi:MAG: hypothetical protein M3R38_29295 [Actinomycetota bacterium]|nr:hypothetical protein [Actinomycetota bacterium]
MIWPKRDEVLQANGDHEGPDKQGNYLTFCPLCGGLNLELPRPDGDGRSAPKCRNGCPQHNVAVALKKNLRRWKRSTQTGTNGGKKPVGASLAPSPETGRETALQGNGYQPDQDLKDLRNKSTSMPHWEWLKIAFELELEPTEKLVLVAFATHTNTLGGSIFPRKKRIAWMTNLSLRHVRTLAGRLVKKKILLESRVQGSATRYRLNPDLADHPGRVSFEEWDWKMAEKECGAGGK